MLLVLCQALIMSLGALKYLYFTVQLKPLDLDLAN